MKDRIGYLPEDALPYMNLTARDNMEYLASLREIGDVEGRIEYLSEELQLSRGSRQKLAITLSILHRPPVLVMDEP